MILFCSAMLVISALSLRVAGRDGRRATGWAAFWMLTLFAAYTLGLGVLALFSPAGTSGPLFELYHLMMLTGVPTGLFGVGLFAMFLLAADLAEAMRQLAASDPLTGILNRRGFDQAAIPMIAQCKRKGRSLTLVIADIDRFKAINDRFGHSLGDTVLQRFTAHITATIGQQDLFGRLGGEEFVMLLPETGATAAIEAMERIRAGLVDAVPELADSGALTASFGVAVLNGPHDMLCDLLQRADEALYCSKLDGRDRISVAPTPGPAVDRLSAAWPPMRRAAG
jgi:diguanylate cyclase (GGDEF)-like protein